MKIKTDFDRYDIKSLNEIVTTVSEIEKKCAMLEQCGLFIKMKVKAVSMDFTSINFERIEKATDHYLKKMNEMRAELLELIKSCKEFEKIIAFIWS